MCVLLLLLCGEELDMGQISDPSLACMFKIISGDDFSTFQRLQVWK